MSLAKNSAQLSESVRFIRSKTSVSPRIGIILGSGLGSFAENLQKADRIATSVIPHYPGSTVPGHKGNLVFGYLHKIPMLAVQGRTHYYEGHSIHKVAYVVRIMAEMGVKKLLVTNASGAVNPLFRPGDLMIITDHINMLFRNPLRGTVWEGESRFPDMHSNYHPPYIDLIQTVGLELKIPLRRGVLYVSSGPTYETAAEVKMVRKLGGDAVSMSTVPEVLVARARGIKVAGISCITNFATGLSAQPLSHSEVTEIAQRVRVRFQKLVEQTLLKMDACDD